jgi:hypothetical protein
MEIIVTDEPEGFRLWISECNGMSVLPAGARLFRANPPDVKFVHANRKDAEADAKKLQKYIATYRLAERERKKK